MNTPFRRLFSSLGAERRRLACRVISRVQVRRLSLHEYQCQQLLRDAGLPAPAGKLVRSPKEAYEAAEALGPRCKLKPQVLAPYQRPAAEGSARNLHRAHELSAVKQAAESLFHTSSQHGPPVTKLYVEEALEDAQEWVLEIRLDRENYHPTLHVRNCESSASDVSTRSYPLSVLKGIEESALADIGTCLGVATEGRSSINKVITGLYSLFLEKDAVWLQVTLSKSNTGLSCSGTRLTIDDAASKRQQALFASRDTEAEVPEEIDAERFNLVYVKLPGDIGTVVNGAGLAMATNDALAHHGGASANFLDAGGQATVETMKKAFSIILSDQRVKVILVNIYGGIIKCDMIAQSIISTAKSLGPLRVPVVVRLQGTNWEEGLQLLKEANLGMDIESDFGKAASKAVQLANA